ncbi:MAG: ATP synthase F1 subunit epsilon [Bacteroidota bacterium]|nr:ATP synthase F1 subunit epsilon [Bacteroidota bacterium]
MFLEIITPEEPLFSGEVISVKLPGTAGGFEVLNNHAPLISTLEQGHIKVRTEQGIEESFLIKGGFVEVLNNRVVVLV